MQNFKYESGMAETLDSLAAQVVQSESSQKKKKKKKKNYHTFQQFSNFELLSKDSVKKLVLSVPTKSCSLDPVPTKVVKESLDELVPLLTVIIIHQIHYEKSDSSRAFNPNSQ